MSVVTKRQLNLLQVFMDSNRYLTGQKLSQLLNVSSKTIRNEIKILNQLMNNFALIQSIPMVIKLVFLMMICLIVGLIKYLSNGVILFLQIL